ncbi:MAG: hypothetical protein R3Y21_05370 [Mycoplasmatota bacterium]
MANVYTQEDKKTLKERYEASGLSKVQFCKRNSISLSTFCAWFKNKPNEDFGLYKIKDEKTKYFNFTSDTIELNLKENFDKNLLLKIVEAITNA